MKDGIYEQLLNNELKSKLNNSEFFYKTNTILKSPENAKNLITEYLKEVTRKALDCIQEKNVDVEDSERVLKEIEICNEILDLLRTKLDFDEYKDLDLSMDAEVLEYAFKKLNNNSFDGKNIVRPVTSLVEPTLFTNSSKEISLLSELRKEIASSDEVMLLVSFIRMTGLMPIYEDLKEFTAKGKKLRVISTTYTKATEYKAIEKLLELPNTSIKISYETENQRLHAKAYIFKRNNGFSTFYIGSSNLSRSALVYGDEWNVKLTEKNSPQIFQNVISEFETYWNSYEYKTLNNTEEDKIRLTKAQAACIDFLHGEFDVISFYGRHAMERNMQRTSVGHGAFVIGSRRGTSSHQYNPMMILAEKETTEDAGTCYGMSFVYSGGFKAEVEKDQFGQTRMQMGLQEEQFSYPYNPGLCSMDSHHRNDLHSLPLFLLLHLSVILSFLRSLKAPHFLFLVNQKYNICMRKNTTKEPKSVKKMKNAVGLIEKKCYSTY